MCMNFRKGSHQISPQISERLCDSFSSNIIKISPHEFSFDGWQVIIVGQ
jgi:hypothetical protein